MLNTPQPNSQRFFWDDEMLNEEMFNAIMNDMSGKTEETDSEDTSDTDDDD